VLSSDAAGATRGWVVAAGVGLLLGLMIGLGVAQVRRRPTGS
jgi:hypothetical protein